MSDQRAAQAPRCVLSLRDVLKGPINFPVVRLTPGNNVVKPSSSAGTIREKWRRRRGDNCVQDRGYPSIHHRPVREWGGRSASCGHLFCVVRRPRLQHSCTLPVSIGQYRSVQRTQMRVSLDITDLMRTKRRRHTRLEGFEAGLRS